MISPPSKPRAAVKPASSNVIAVGSGHLKTPKNQRRRNGYWALFAATCLTLLLAIVALGLITVLQNQDNQSQVATDHGESLNKLTAILNLKGSSVKAIVNGQGVIVGYLVSNNDYSKAICQALPQCVPPGKPTSK